MYNYCVSVHLLLGYDILLLLVRLKAKHLSFTFKYIIIITYAQVHPLKVLKSCKQTTRDNII